MSRVSSGSFFPVPVSSFLLIIALFFGQFCQTVSAFKSVSDKTPATTNQSETDIDNEPKKGEISRVSIKPAARRNSVRHFNKKKTARKKPNGAAKKNIAEIEIVESEEPESWSSLSSFLRNTSAVNLKPTESLYLKKFAAANKFAEIIQT